MSVTVVRAAAATGGAGILSIVAVAVLPAVVAVPVAVVLAVSLVHGVAPSRPHARRGRRRLFGAST
jgi:hypothetical protein